MTDITALVEESRQKWNKAYDILVRASRMPAEPVPPLTHKERGEMVDFSNTFRRLLVELHVLPGTVSMVDLNRIREQEGSQIAQGMVCPQCKKPLEAIISYKCPDCGKIEFKKEDAASD